MLLAMGIYRKCSVFEQVMRICKSVIKVLTMSRFFYVINTWNESTSIHKA